MKSNIKAFKRKLIRREIQQILLSLMIFTIVYIVLSVGVNYLKNIVYYNKLIDRSIMDEVIYLLRRFFPRLPYDLFIVMWIMGCALILFLRLLRLIRQITEIYSNIQNLFLAEHELVELPDSLNPIEIELNRLKLDTLRNERIAREAEQRKNDLIVYLAHDLKTPLTSVIGYLDLLHEETQISEEMRGKYLGIALKKSERLEELINEFFEIARFNLKSLTLETSNINLTRMLEQISYEFLPLMSPKNLTCSLLIDKDLMIRGDVKKLERVFDNLIRNAISYSYENSDIVLSAEKDEKQVTITFRNQGDTIPDYKLEHIFEQFYRLDNSRGTNQGGAGLGLAIAKEIVELHKGTISVFSKENIIEFTVTLPS